MAELAHEVALVDKALELGGEVGGVADFEVQPIDPIAHVLGHAADVARDDRRVRKKRFVDRNRRVLKPHRRHDKHVDLGINLRQLGVVKAAFEVHARAALLSELLQIAMVLVLVRIKAAIHVQLGVDVLAEQAHCLDQNLIALVPNEAANKAKAHDLRLVLFERFDVVGAHPVVRKQKPVRIKTWIRVDQFLAQKATRADPQIGGSKRGRHALFTLAQVRILGCHRLVLGAAKAAGEARCVVEQLVTHRTELAHSGHALDHALFDAQIAARSHVAVAALAVGANHLHARANRPIVVARDHGGQTRVARDVHQVDRRVNQMLKVHQIRAHLRNHLAKGRFGAGMLKALLEVAVL